MQNLVSQDEAAVGAAAEQQAPEYSLRAPRYRTVRGEELNTSFVIDGKPHSISVELIDLSLRGAKVQAPVPLAPGTMVSLYAAPKNDDVELTVRAEIRWCEPVMGGVRVGCYFPEEIRAGLLQQWAEAGYLERRMCRRTTAEMPVSVREELNSGTAESGEIVDYSSQGLRLLVASPKSVGQRLLIEVCDQGSPSSVPLKTMWQKESEGGFDVGCCFTDRSGFESIQRFEQSTRPGSLLRRAAQLRLSGVWPVGLASVIALGALRWLGGLEMLLSWLRG